MNELFLKSSKLKIDIEKSIENLYNSKEFNLSAESKGNIQEEYNTKMMKLELSSKEITTQLNLFLHNINTMKLHLVKIKKNSTPETILISQK